MMIDMVVADCIVDDVVKTVIEAARTGQQGDGRVFVIPVEEAYTIRTRCGGPD
jgi:nitrogen regulatory protein PII